MADMPQTNRQVLQAHACSLSVGTFIFLVAMVAHASQQHGRIYIDDSPAVQELIEKAAVLKSTNRLTDSARTYQQVIDNYPTKLIESNDNIFIAANRWTRQQVLSNPSLSNAYTNLYEPMAEQLLIEALYPRPDIHTLKRIWTRFGACPSGLDAALAVASLHLEQGEAVDAAMVLDDLINHPQLSARTNQFHLLQATAGLFLGDRGKLRLELHSQSLASLGAVEKVGLLQTWQPSLTESVASNITTQENGRGRYLGNHLDKPAHINLFPTDVSSQAITPRLRPLGRSRNFRKLLSQPVIDDDLVYIQHGDSIVAVDRVSLHIHWRFPNQYQVKPTLQKRVQVTPRWPGQKSRQPCLLGNSLIAVIGPNGGHAERGRSSSALVCLNRDDGRVRWKVEPGDLDPPLVNTQFRGTPIRFGQSIIVGIRRTQRSQFQDSYIAAIDPATGRMLWRRHVASAKPNHLAYPDEPMTMIVDGARLYAHDQLGVLAALDCHDGSPIWIVKLPPDRAPLPGHNAKGGRQVNRISSSLIPRPILVPAGLIVPFTNPLSPPLLIDPTTGLTKRLLTGPGWTDARHFISLGRNVLCVARMDGSEFSFRLIDGATMKVIGELELDGTGAVFYHHVAPDGKSLLIVNGPSLLEVSLPELVVLQHHQISETGNLIANHGQILITNGSSLYCYMDWDWEYERLKERIKTIKFNPGPALALMHLAAITGHDEQVLEGADAAIASLSQRAENLRDGPPIRTVGDLYQRTVFDQLLFLAKQAKDTNLAGELFARLGYASYTTSDTIAYQFHFGRFHERRGRLAEAMNYYQFILMDQTLSAQLYRWDKGVRRADLEAQLRQAKLMAQDRSLYKPFEDEAIQRLENFLQDATLPADYFVELARQYPHSTSSTRALVRAAQIVLENADATLASEYLRHAYRLAKDRRTAERVVEQMINCYRQTGRPEHIQQWLEQLQHDYPESEIPEIHRASPDLLNLKMTIKSPPEDLNESNRLQLPLKHVNMITGQLVTPRDLSRLHLSEDHFLFVDSEQLRLHSGDDFQERWSVPVRGNAIDLVDLGSQQIIVYNRTNSMIGAYETTTGHPSWPKIDIRNLINAIGSVGQPNTKRHALIAQRVPTEAHDRKLFSNRIRLAGLPKADHPGKPGNPGVRGDLKEPAGRSFEVGNQKKNGSVTNQPLIAFNDQDLVVADPFGRVIGLDSNTGLQHWGLLSKINNVAMLAMDQDLLVLAGSTTTARGALLVLDPTTGQELFPLIHLQNRPQWVGLHHNGSIICITNHSAALYSSTGGEVIWRYTPQRRGLGQLTYVGDEDLLIQDSTRSMLMLHVEDGTLIRPITDIAIRSNPVLDAIMYKQRWHLLTTMQSISVSRSGHIEWHNAISEDHQRFVGQAISGPHIFLVAQIDSDDQEPDRNPKSINPVADLTPPLHVSIQTNYSEPQRPPPLYRIYVLDRTSGSVIDQYDLPDLDAPLRHPKIVMGNGKQLMIVGQDKTLVVSGNNQVPTTPDTPKRVSN